MFQMFQTTVTISFPFSLTFITFLGGEQWQTTDCWKACDGTVKSCKCTKQSEEQLHSHSYFAGGRLPTCKCWPGRLPPGSFTIFDGWNDNVIWSTDQGRQGVGTWIWTWHRCQWGGICVDNFHFHFCVDNFQSPLIQSLCQIERVGVKEHWIVECNSGG